MGRVQGREGGKIEAGRVCEREGMKEGVGGMERGWEGWREGERDGERVRGRELTGNTIAQNSVVPTLITVSTKLFISSSTKTKHSRLFLHTCTCTVYELHTCTTVCVGDL